MRTILAVVATAVIAGGASADATPQLMTRDIRDGTILKRDLSQKLRSK